MPVEVASKAPPELKWLVTAHNARLRGDLNLAAEFVSRVDRDAASKLVGLMVIEQRLALGDASAAAFTLARIREDLNGFEGTITEFEIAAEREPWMADAILRDLLPFGDSPDRRARIGADLILRGTAAQAGSTLRYWRERMAQLSTEDLGMCWLIAKRFDVADAEAWDNEFRQRTGQNFPRVIGEQIVGSDRSELLNAYALLVGRVPLSRELVFALFLQATRLPLTNAPGI